MPGGHTPGAATTTAFCLRNRCGPMAIAVIRHANSATEVAVERAYRDMSASPKPVHTPDARGFSLSDEFSLPKASKVRHARAMIKMAWWSLIAAVLGLFEPPAASWVWPVGGDQIIVRDFVAPETPWGAGHRGIDIDASASATLLAPTSGRLRFVGDVVSRGVVTIETSQGFLVSMEPVTIDLPSGSMVRAGQVMGSVDSGHCRSRCLHLGLRIDRDYVSPTAFLGVQRRAVLLPWAHARG
jgi:murein DD-endopeptidase MepM/ murein hydrolase activator NlpD